MSNGSFTSSVWDNFKQIFAAVILAVIIKSSIVEAYKIPSSSMEDTLLVGDFLLANKVVYGAKLPLVDWRLPAISEPQQGDIVIFIFPRDGVTKYIKRCVGTPGDTVEVRDKVVFVNGKEFLPPKHSKFSDVNWDGTQKIHPRPPRDNFGPYVVPANSYFMMGDNRDNSWDSRFWVSVRKENVLGEAMMIHWSWDDTIYPSPDVSAADPLSVPRMFVFNAVHFFEKVRWERLFSTLE